MSGAASYYPARFGRGVVPLTNSSLNAGLGGDKPVMGITPRYNIHSRQSQRDPWDHQGSRMAQADVTVNMNVNRDLIRARHAQMNQDGTRTLGAVLNPDVLQIMENDPIFIPRHAQTKTGVAMATSRNPLFAFSSFTGMQTTPSMFPNQEQFESAFYYVGRAKIAYLFGDTTQGQTGVSVQVSGAHTIANVGVTTFAMGDRVRWRLFAIDDAIRKQQVSLIRRPKDHPAHKFGAIWERATYEQMFRLTQTALDNYMRMHHLEGSAKTRKAYLTRSAQDVIVEATTTVQEQHFQSECINSTVVDMWLAITTAAQLGLVTINLPDNPTATELRNLEQFNSIDLQTLKSQTYGPANNSSPARGGSSRQEIYGRSKVLAHALGIVPHANVPVLTELIDIAIQRKYAGLMDGPSSRKFRKGAAIVHVADQNTAAGLLDTASASPVDRKLHHAQLNAAREADAQFYHMYRHGAEQVAYTCISVNSDPAGVMDVL